VEILLSLSPSSVFMGMGDPTWRPSARSPCSPPTGSAAAMGLGPVNTGGGGGGDGDAALISTTSDIGERGDAMDVIVPNGG
jgi:hypothetical protein